MYLGIALYGYEAVGTLFPIRNTMQNPKKITLATIITFLILGFFFLVTGLSTYFIFGNDTKDSVFACYDRKNDMFFFILQTMFIFFLAPWMPLYIIALFEPFEYFEGYKDFLKNSSGQISRYKLVAVRATGTVVIVGLCMMSNNVNVLTEFAGNLVNPLCSFVIPIFMVHAKAFWIDKQRKSIVKIIHDMFIFIFSFAMMI